jgi:hypothetical protein
MKQLPLLLFAAAALHAASLPPLDRVLARTGRAVEAFWNDLLAVNCHESILEAKLAPNGKVMAQQAGTFDYLLVAHLAPDDLSVQESRVPIASKPEKKGGPPLLVTSGFATLLLVLHPFYQGDYEFTAPVDDTLDGHSALRIDFRQVHGGRSPSCLRLRGRDYPLPWRGQAWIDPDTAVVRRISVSLASSMEDVGLNSLTADVRYAPVAFKDAGQLWLPAEARIEAATPRQHWRNVHRFTDYRRFSVETTTHTEAPR